MPKISEKGLEAFFKIKQTKFGFVVNFRNAHDGMFYIQSTIRKRPFTLVPPRNILEDGVERHLDWFERHHGYEPWSICCETRTYVLASRWTTHLVMTCLVSVWKDRHRRVFGRKFSATALKTLALDMGSLFQNVEISRMTAGMHDLFEESGWYAQVFCKMRLQFFTRPWRRFPVAVLSPTPEKLEELDLYGVKSNSRELK